MAVRIYGMSDPDRSHGEWGTSVGIPCLEYKILLVELNEADVSMRLAWHNQPLLGDDLFVHCEDVSLPRQLLIGLIQI